MNPTVPPSAVLLAKLAAVRRRQLAVLVGTGLARWVLVATATLAVVMGLDWRYELPRWGRAILWGAALTGWAAVAWRQLWRPVARRADVEGAALLVEQTAREFHGRLIAAVQLARPGLAYDAEEAQFVRALVAQTERVARWVDFRRAIDTRPLWRWVSLAVVAASALTLVPGGLWRRAFLSNEPVPRQTRVRCLTGSVRVGRGATVVLRAQAEGIVPATGTVWLQYGPDRRAEFAMEPEPDNPRVFRRAIPSVQESFRYTLRLNDGRSGPHQVTVVAPPVVVELHCRQEFPAYTRLPPVARRPTELTLLAGSRLGVTARANKDIARAVVRLVGLQQEVPLQVGTDPRRGTAVVAIPQTNLTGLAVHLCDTDGVESSDDPIYPVTILPDQPPQVTITAPRREEWVTPRATVIVGIEAHDDFGVENVTFHCRVGDAEATARAVVLDLNGETPTTLRRRYEWRLPALLPHVSIGDTVTYWIEATDNNTATGPRRAMSDRYTLRVVSDDEKRAELMARFSDSVGLLAKIAGEQEELNKKLGDLIFERGAGNRRRDQ